MNVTLIFFSLLVFGGTILLNCYCNGDRINVHLIPHSHDDVGWLKTVDEYYYGGNRSIVQIASVQYILDSVMTELAKNRDRKFIYVEIAFFYRWWNEQTDQMKDQVREFVKNGQLEFINGGWCMNDEATAHYNAIIDQMTLGLKFIENNFGPDARPTIGWHIDPFGHSAEQASIFAQMGFNGFFLGRIDYGDKGVRLNQTQMEMIWRGSNSLKQRSDIFTGVLYDDYRPPKGFCFDEGCKDDPIQDDPNLEDYNVDRRVKEFIEAAFNQAKHYRINNILMTMGEDFQYTNALMWFKNLDKLIKYVNMNDSVNVMYSTPSIYLDYVHKANETWSIKTDDFFPYADKPHSFWTGYFTSRPALKGYVRKCNNRLQVCKQLEAIVNGVPDQSSTKLKMAMAVAQHHDAVAGTEKQHVANDYAKRLHIGEQQCDKVISLALSSLIVKNKREKLDLRFCEYLNISACPSSESGNFNLAVYNPLARPYQWYLRFPVNVKSISVYDPDGKPLPVQILPVSNATIAVRGNLSNALFEAVVSLISAPVPPLGYAVYTVRENATTAGLRNAVGIFQPMSKMKYPNDDVTISNEYYQIDFSSVTGHINQITNLHTKLSAKIDQQYYWYISSHGDINSSQCSGAYIFRPNQSEVVPVNLNNNRAKIVSVSKNALLSVVEQQFAPWLNQVVRLYSKVPAIEIEYTIGPIPYKDGLGKEVISRFNTDLETDSTFYTDANGREIQKRVRNYRPTWNYNNTEPVAGNYYPVNSRIFIKDEKSGKRQFTIMTDRSQGGSSLQDGSIELMLHRRIFHDDQRGVHEPLNETGQYGDGLIIRGKQYVMLDNVTSSTFLHRLFGEGLMLQPELAFTESIMKYSDMKKDYNLLFSILKMELPLEVHLLTFELLDLNVYLLRLEHQFELNDSVYNSNITVSLNDLFSYKFKIKSITELSLGANAALCNIKRYSWGTKDEGFSHRPVVTPPHFDVHLSPMEIRTFNITMTTI